MDDHDRSDIHARVVAGIHEDDRRIKKETWGDGLTTAKRASTTLLRAAQSGKLPPHLMAQIALLHKAIHDKVTFGVRLVSINEKPLWP